VIDPHLSPDGTHVAYVRDRDLYVTDLATSEEARLTTSGDPSVTNGLAEFVAQEEMQRFGGFWWSPDGKRLAFEEADSRPVETFWLADPAHPEQEPQAVPYPRAGRANARVRLGVVAATGGAPTWVRWDEARFPYLATVAWGQGGPLALVVQSRDQRELELLAADPSSGATARLLAERDEAWLDLDQSVPRWLPDGSGFLWSSDRGGSRQLELRDATGALVRVVSSGAGEYARLVDIDGARRTACFLATPEPSEMHLFRASLDGGAPERLTAEAGVHDAAFGRSHRLYALTSVSLRAMARASVHALEGVHALQSVHASTQAGAAPVALPSVAEEPSLAVDAAFAALPAEGPRAVLVRPRGFDPGRRYPVVLHVYGGPHAQQALAALSQNLLRQWIADHGYVVVAVDGRGTPHRGRAWGRAIAGDFGTVPLEDQVAALRALAARHPELDLARVGVFGWSFGGYLAAMAALRRPDLFRAAVAGAPVVDWRDYDTHYTERYLGVDAQGEPYRKSSLLGYAPSLSRPLLLVHGTRDDNVYFLHTIKLADALFRAGRPFELLALPGLTHMVADPIAEQRLYERIVAFFSANI
jgi:dipeptidyl-peptidase-4